MAAIELEDHQIVRRGVYPAPNVMGYNSLFFHAPTSGYDTDTYMEWGKELTAICEKRNIPYYYFYNDRKTKINVYPTNVIDEWWDAR